METREALIERKISEGWENKISDFGYGSRRWYLRKGQFEVTYNRYGNYRSPDNKEVNIKFMAIEDFLNKNKEVMKIINEYVNATSLIEASSYYELQLQIIAQDLIIDKKEICEL